MNDEINITWLSLFPSIVTLTLAFLSRQVIVALFIGIATGGVVYAWQTQDLGNLNIINSFLLPALGTNVYASLLLIYLWCLGGIVGIWHKTGSAEYFAEHLGKKIASGARSSLLFSWMLGMIFHQGGTVSTILTGTTIKPIADHYKVSHEELAYVVDSTASPVATIIPFNAWPMYITGLIVGTIPFIDTPLDGYKFFLASLPFNFYAIVAVSMTFLFAIGWLPWVGKAMKQAMIRARTTGELDGPDARPLINAHEQLIVPSEDYVPSLLEFIVPIILLLTITITPFVAWKLGYITEKYANCTNEAFMLATLSAIVIAKFRGMHFNDIIEGFMSGCREMTVGAMIFALALTLALVTKKLHTADYLIHLLSDGLPAVLLPLSLTLLCMIAAFSTGSAFGTYAVVFPIAFPLAYSINPNTADPFFLHVCFGAVLGGTVFGDQCSPISDTTIFSSMFTGCDLMDHVKTQLPLALVAACCSALLSTLILLISGF